MHSLINEELGRAKMAELRARAESGGHARAAAVQREMLAAERARAGVEPPNEGVFETWEAWLAIFVSAAFLAVAFAAGPWRGLVVFAGVVVAVAAAGFWFGADSRDPDQRWPFAAPERRRAGCPDAGTIRS